MKDTFRFPLDIQFFAEDPANDPAEDGQGNNTESTEEKGDQNSQPVFDYDKLAGILEGRQKATEESVLKGYFKQQGITGEEAAQAIADFKKQKASKTPDIASIQAQLNAANSSALQATMENKALLMASDLGVDLKAMPYLIKMADLTEAVKDGKVDDEKLKGALNKVLEAVPQLKAKVTAGDGKGAGIRVGADTSGGSKKSEEDELAKAFGIKEKKK